MDDGTAWHAGWGPCGTDCHPVDLLIRDPRHWANEASAKNGGFGHRSAPAAQGSSHFSRHAHYAGSLPPTGQTGALWFKPALYRSNEFGLERLSAVTAYGKASGRPAIFFRG